MNLDRWDEMTPEELLILAAGLSSDRGRGAWMGDHELKISKALEDEIDAAEDRRRKKGDA